jgi:hypothetical protein
VITWRLPVAIAVLLALAGATAYFTFPRMPNQGQGTNISIPDRRPADDVAGAAGWHWPDGTPGWKAGETINAYNVSGVQPIELQAAQLVAARNTLNSESLRVVVAVRPGYKGVLAIVSAHASDGWTPLHDVSCLAAILPGDAPVVWECPGAFPDRPGDLSRRHVLVAAAGYTWPSTQRYGKTYGPSHVVDLAGVARGDVRRVVLAAPGLRQDIYTRGKTWGEFQSTTTLPQRPWKARLIVYGRHGVVEVVSLDVAAGRSRVFR